MSANNQGAKEHETRSIIYGSVDSRLRNWRNIRLRRFSDTEVQVTDHKTRIYSSQWYLSATHTIRKRHGDVREFYGIWDDSGR